MLEGDQLPLRSVLDNADIGVVIHRWDTSIVYVNRTAMDLLRLTYEQMIGKDALDPQWHFVNEANQRLAPEDYPVNKVKRTSGVLSNEILGIKDGSSEVATWVKVEAFAEHFRNDAGFIIVTFYDITRDKFIFSSRDILEEIQDIVIVTEAEHLSYPLGPKIVYVNHAFETVTGYSADEVIGQTPRILQGKETDRRDLDRIAVALANKEPVKATLLNYTKSGCAFWLEMNIVPLENQLGRLSHFVAVGRDVTEQVYYSDQLEKRNQDLNRIRRDLEMIVESRTQELKQANERLQELAYNDTLTKLPNRHSFTSQASSMVSLARRHNLYLVIGLLDLDHFKSINDNHGHEAGDRVLEALGSCLRHFFRQEDVYGRIGGEEFAFAILVEERQSATGIAERLLAEIRSLRTETADGEPLSITGSIGLCLVPPGVPVKLDAAMRTADKALYRSKSGGRDQVQLNEFNGNCNSND